MQTNKKENARVNTLKRRPLLYQAVKEEIKNYIIDNNLQPGDKLPPETELAQQFGVSRTSVREAVKSLESLGILEARPGAGLCVRSFSFDPLIDNLAYGMMFDIKDLNNILEIRFHIEHGMVWRAVEMVDDEQLARLDANLEKMRKLAENDEYSAAVDREFHNILWANVDNSMVVRILDIFWQIFYQARQRANLTEPHDPMEAYHLHARIVNDLRRHDAPAMSASMERHHGNILERVRKLEKEMPAGSEA